jgi:hypothetical protein
MARDRHANGGQGMNWIRKEKRLALYLRDGLACSYCGSGIEDGERLTLDHLTPHSHGGGNGAENLVTACNRCNASRGNRDWREFAVAVAAYLDRGVQAADIIGHIETTVGRAVDVAAAKALIARRGGFTTALKG